MEKRGGVLLEGQGKNVEENMPFGGDSIEAVKFAAMGKVLIRIQAIAQQQGLVEELGDWLKVHKPYHRNPTTGIIQKLYTETLYRNP